MTKPKKLAKLSKELETPTPKPTPAAPAAAAAPPVTPEKAAAAPAAPKAATSGSAAEDPNDEIKAKLGLKKKTKEVSNEGPRELRRLFRFGSR